MIKCNKSIKLILTAAMLLTALTGCGKEASEPVSEPSPVVTEAPDISKDAEKIVISEVMVKNRASIQDENGKFSDWIELENISDEDVSIGGWYLSDKENELGWQLPADVVIPAKSMLLVFADGGDAYLHADFSLSEDETVSLYNAYEYLVSSVKCEDTGADISLARNPDGSYAQTVYPSPMHANSAEGYDAWQNELAPKGPLVISEVVTANVDSASETNLGYCDWVEIKNISSEAVSLSDYYLSDDKDDYRLWKFEDRLLNPGECLLVYCDDSDTEAAAGNLRARFSLNAEQEELFLFSESTGLVDYISAKDIPYRGSCGRQAGENGYFYFSRPTPGQDNSGGVRRVCEKPVASVASGQYDGVESLTIELSADCGEVWYTLDGDAPGAEAIRYTEPIVISQTTIIQAVTKSSGMADSGIAVFSYFVNEGHSLPILAYNAEDYDGFVRLYNDRNKIYHTDCVGTLALYEDGSEVFNQRCGLRMKGFSSIAADQKKNMAAYFRAKYGDGDIEGIDLFENGIDTYSSIAFRSGQDQYYSNMRNELLQELCLQLSDIVPTQHNKYVVLYTNGRYMGLYAMKENMNEHYYASLKDVPSESVSVYHRISDLAREEDEIYEAISFCLNNDMSDAEKYAQFSQMFDIDCLIDFLVIYSYGGNTDTLNNIRLFKSTADDNKWRFSFYDQDRAMVNAGYAVKNVFNYLGQAHYQLSAMANQLCKNAEFKDAFLRRYAEAVNTVLSDENVLAQLDTLYNQIKPEMERDRVRWGSNASTWEGHVETLRTMIENDYAQHTVSVLCESLRLSQEEIAKYFG